jgi:hypothetical protein
MLVLRCQQEGLCALYASTFGTTDNSGLKQSQIPGVAAVIQQPTRHTFALDCNPDLNAKGDVPVLVPKGRVLEGLNRQKRLLLPSHLV